MNTHKWVGPFEFGKLLKDSIVGQLALPPDHGSAYLVSKHSWQSKPDSACVPLYVGGTTGKEARFRTRIGDLVADLFGFYVDKTDQHGKTGHHSGGQSLHKWCKQNKVNPLSLHIAWVEPGGCHRCLENELYTELVPKLCKKSPPSCKDHGGS